eukprot:Skav207872  [mRNA]  locus=scaffold1988:161804:162229:- [translate_table: standard]
MDEVGLHSVLVTDDDFEGICRVPRIRHGANGHTDPHSHSDVGSCRPLAQNGHDDDHNGINARHLALETQLISEESGQKGCQDHWNREPLEGVEDDHQHDSSQGCHRDEVQQRICTHDTGHDSQSGDAGAQASFATIQAVHC